MCRGAEQAWSNDFNDPDNFFQVDTLVRRSGGGGGGTHYPLANITGQERQARWSPKQQN